MTELVSIDVPRKRKWFAILLSNPFEVALGALFGALGIVLMVGGFMHPDDMGQHLLPNFLMWVWTATLALGGPLMLIGMFWTGDASLGRSIETSGLLLSGSVWLTYMLTYVFMLGLNQGVLSSIVLFLGCALRILALRRVNAAVQRLAPIDEE